MFRKDYIERIDNFIMSNKFSILNSDPTNAYQKCIRNNLNSCKAIIHNEVKPKLINLNRHPPSIRGLIKVHNSGNPVSPIVNWINAPAYQTAKFFTASLCRVICLPYAFSIKNSLHLINDLKEIKINPNTRLASFDISNMYTNFPTQDLQHIITNILNHTTSDPLERHEYLKLYEVVINQNYFTHNNNFYKQKEGLAMGAPSFTFLSEIYLQYVEFNYIVDIITKYNILGYFRYVDDILIICDSTNTDIYSVLNEFNKIQPQL
jgi:hypothetical protein